MEYDASKFNQLMKIPMTTLAMWRQYFVMLHMDGNGAVLQKMSLHSAVAIFGHER
jgi:hypothetical protein